MSNLDQEPKVVWTVSINRRLAERIVHLLPKDDMDIAPKKGSRSQLIEGLLKDWADRTAALQQKGSQ